MPYKENSLLSSIATRLPAWKALFLALAAGLSFSHAADTGIDTPAPIGPFLDNVFPSQAPGGSGGWAVEKVFTGIHPSLVTCALPYPGTNKILIVEKQGRILTFDNDPNVSSMQVFLDYRAQTYNNSDSGMSNLVFHPEFGQPGSPHRGYVFVTYKYSPNGDTGTQSYWRLSRFTVPDGQTTADPNSEVVFIQMYDRHQWHDSGCMMFGPDGFLYVAIGDEGGGNDPYDNTQKINDRLYSGMLRIDPDTRPDRSHPIRRSQQPETGIPEGWPGNITQHYYIPNDNPWVSEDGGNLEEFYAIGLRSPYRFSRDPVSGRVWIGDVGEQTREEVSELSKGANFEWAYREGSIPGPKQKPDPLIGTSTPPLWDYGRDEGFAVILGPFYYGNEHPSLRGKCIVSDYVTGKVWALTPGLPGAPVTAEPLVTITTPGSIGTRGITSYLELPDGEVLILKINGQEISEFYKLVRTGATIPEPPALLSQTGAFSNLAALTPRPGLITYAVNSPLWSDNALKKRWLAIPNDGNPDTPAEKIAFSPDSEWTFPPGSVFVKHFELATDETNPSAIRRLETRFIVIGANGEPYGVTYRWRPDGTDADLLPGAASDIIDIALAGGSTRQQTWSYPSRSNCLTCHNAAAHHILGVKTHQLNGEIIYPETGRTANQLATLNHLGFLDAAYNPDHLPYFLKSVSVDNISAPLESRVRSYIDSNCAQCHRPGGVRASFDARFATPLDQQNLIRGHVEAPFLGGNEAVIQPGDPTHSVALQRINTVGTGQMPPIAKSIVDTHARDAIQSWIQSLSQGPSVSLAHLDYYPDGDAFVTATFSSPVEDFGANDVHARGGSIVSVDGSGANYTIRVKFLSGAPATLWIPSGAASANSFGSYASPSLKVSPLQPNLIAWLKLDDTSTESLENSAAPSNVGILSGSTSATEGIIGKARLFTGGRATLPNNLGDDFTLSFWMRADAPFPQTDVAVQGSLIFFSDAPFAAEECLLSGMRNPEGVNRVYFQTGSDSIGNRVTLQAGIPVTIGQWTHVAITRVKSTHEIVAYINGQFCGRVIAGAETLGNSPTIELGGSADTSYAPFAGALDQFRIFSRKLTETEIAKLAAETVDDTTSPVERWLATTMPGLGHIQDLTLDPDSDGLSNLGEYAFGTDPLSTDAPAISYDISDDRVSSLSFPVREGENTGIAYNIELSHNLQTWQPAGPRLTLNPDTPSPDPGYLLRAATITPQPGDPTKRTFLRIRPTGDPR